ncbi:MAG: T9SS type A sorting domain-containing protein [Bacteroidales bacterium]|nr:T9SS type A sorting domain-containing protein [Bacteroidales bacterium]
MNRILSFVFVACLALISFGAFAQTNYVKIASTDQLVDGGKYLIVYEAGNVAFDGSLTTLDAIANTKSVTISDGAISVTDNDFYFTLDEIEDGYSVKSASGYYIGDTANVNKLISSETEAFSNTIEFSESGVEIICSGNRLRYNSNDDQTRFRYYKASGYANQQAIALYIDASYLGSDPMISIITPTNGSTIYTSTVTATVQVINFAAGTDGNISFSIDEETAIAGTETSHTFADLAEGQHTIHASLVGTDETVVATATSTFTVNLSGPTTTPIHDIQYTEAEDGASPLNGETVTVSGTVTAFNSDKFYIQDAEEAWSGLYIYNTNSSWTPALSDNVTVTGAISEYNGLTELTPTEIINNGASTPINGLALASISEIAEPYESVLVTVTGTCTNIGGAKKWTISDGTSIVVFGLTYTPTVGTSYTVTGIVDWFGQDGIWELKPRSESDIVAGASVPSITISNPANGSTVYSASVNATVEVFNFEVGTDGNISFSIDNEDAISGTATSHAFTGLAEGEHTIHASLVANDQTVVASATSTFTVNLAGPTFTAIRDIQYTTEESGDSPLNNRTVWVKGVVTSNFLNTPYSPVKGYSIQDANDAWSGVWVFDSINNPNIGDSVKLQALVTEYYGLTELKNVANYEVFDIGVATPINVTVNEAKSEAYEGCYVRVECVRSTGHTMPYGNWTCVNAAGDTVTFSHNFANDAYTIQDDKYYSVAGVVEYSYGKYYVNYPTVNDIIADCDASVDEMLANAIEVYPNPTNGQINIANAEGQNIVVINTLGQVVASIDNATENQTIDMSGLCEGTYFVKVGTSVVKINVIR